MDGHFYDVQHMIKNGRKSDSFSAHDEQHFKYTTPHTDLQKYMLLKLVKQFNKIGAMKSFMKYYCNLCIEKWLTILKKLRDKNITIMKKNGNIRNLPTQTSFP